MKRKLWPHLMEKALLVTIELKTEAGTWGIDDAARELEELSVASLVEPQDNIICICDKPTPNFLIGSGKAKELAILAQELDVAVVIFSHDLSGTQQRNLEEIIGKKTIDRTQLILDIFARRARSQEGKMQVELAQLQYIMPRLVGKGIILSRLGGGVGTRGPGEQKLEVDRRIIRKRIDRLKKDLKSVSEHRKIMRKKRKDNCIPLVALVGYTSAGKSTLLNSLTASDQIVSSSLFTTLDPLAKNLKLPNGENIIISDTVGFLHDLPHNLVEAFKATLEEVAQADLLIHVLDGSHALIYEHNKAVLQVLKQLELEDKPIITAINKIDLLEDKSCLDNFAKDFNSPISISAKLGENLDKLLEKIQDFFSERMVFLDILIPHARMDLVDIFHRQGKVEEISYLQNGIKVKVNLPRVLYQKLLKDRDLRNIC